MYRLMILLFSAVLVGMFIGAGAMKLNPGAPVKSAVAVVDLAGIVERQRIEVLRLGKDPDASERMIQIRMLHLATILADFGQKQLIVNKAAIVTGMLPDLTKQIEEQLSSSKEWNK